MALLSVEHLTKHFSLGRSLGAALRRQPSGWIKPVEDVSFPLPKARFPASSAIRLWQVHHLQPDRKACRFHEREHPL